MERFNKRNGIDDLLVKYITGNASAEEQKEVKTWISESAANRRYFDEIKEIYKAAKVAGRADDFRTDLFWERVKARHYSNLTEKLTIEKRKVKRAFIRDVLKYAAIIAIAVSSGVLGYRYINARFEIKEREIWNTVEAPFGSRVRMTLPDGSNVWLNAGSQLRYSSLFGQMNRTVFLNGEGYFKVESDTGKQFIVSTDFLDIKVYGTEFNVKAYDDEDIIQTTLVSGSLAIEGRLGTGMMKKTIMLEPNQTATYFKTAKREDKEYKNIPEPQKLQEEEDGNILPVSKNLEIKLDVNPAIYTSWKDPLWHIERETLRSLAAKFERRFNVKFVFESDELAEYRFTGKLKDETLEQVLNLMKLSAPIEYKIKDNQVVLSENKYFKKIYNEMLIKNK